MTPHSRGWSKLGRTKNDRDVILIARIRKGKR